MASVPLSSFAPTASIAFRATQASANVVLPTTGTPTVAVVTNLGQKTVFVALGSSSVTVNQNGGIAIAPAAAVVLTIGTNTNLAAAALAGACGLNITVGS